MKKKLAVFDFDNTLVMSDSKIKITHKDGKISVLNTHQYAHYKKQPGDSVDYSEFNQIINPRPMSRYIIILKSALKSLNTDVVILTARGNEEPIAEYLKSLGFIDGLKIKALDSSSPNAKKKYLSNRLKKYNYSDLYFFDDSKSNVDAINSLRGQVDAMVHAHLVPPEKYLSTSAIDKNKLHSLLKQRILNPVTKRRILVSSALKYPQTHLVFKLAKIFIKNSLR